MRRVARLVVITLPALVLSAVLTQTSTPAAAAPTAVSAAGPTAVTGTARQWVNVRGGATTKAPSVGHLSGKQVVTIRCQQVGALVRGPGGPTDLWDMIGEGRYVSHSYVTAMTGTPLRCGVPEPIGSATAAQKAFLATVAGPARQNFTEYRVPPSVTIAQAILESGWGRSAVSTTANNYFGAKCNAAGAGSLAIGCREFPTRECSTSSCSTTTGSFRVYATVVDSLRDHSLILGKARYAAAFRYVSDPDRFAAEIHKAGYATDPRYTELLVGIMKKFDLYRYDK